MFRVPSTVLALLALTVLANVAIAENNYPLSLAGQIDGVFGDKDLVVPAEFAKGTQIEGSFLLVETKQLEDPTSAPSHTSLWVHNSLREVKIDAPFNLDLTGLSVKHERSSAVISLNFHQEKCDANETDEGLWDGCGVNAGSFTTDDGTELKPISLSVPLTGAKVEELTFRELVNNLVELAQDGQTKALLKYGSDAKGTKVVMFVLTLSTIEMTQK